MRIIKHVEDFMFNLLSEGDREIFELFDFDQYRKKEYNGRPRNR